MRITVAAGLVVLTFIMFTTPSKAQETLPNVKGVNEPGVVGTMSLALKNDSNITRQNPALSDRLIAFTPELGYAALFGKHRALVTYSGDWARYQDNSSFNYTAHDVQLAGFFDWSERFTTEITARYADVVEDPLMVNAVFDSINEYTQVQSQQVETKFTYGRTNGPGQLILLLRAADAEFANNDQSFRNNRTYGAVGSFYYRLGSKHRLLLEAQFINSDFTDPLPSFDQSGDIATYFVGMDSVLSDALSARLKLGYTELTYDDSSLQNVSGLSAEGALNWALSTRSSVSVGLSRQINDSALPGQEGFINTVLSLALKHALSERAELQFDVRLNEQAFQSAEFGDDRFAIVGATAEYQLSERWWFLLGAQYSVRSSDFAVRDFNANELSLAARYQFY